MARTLPKRDYGTLDALVVIGSMVMVSGMIAGFFLVKVEPEIAPILSSIATGIMALPMAYGAFRWGNSASRSDNAQDVRVVNPPEAPAQVEVQP